MGTDFVSAKKLMKMMDVKPNQNMCVIIYFLLQ